MIKINLKQIRRKKPKATRAGGDGQRSGSTHRLSRPVFSSFLPPTLPAPPRRRWRWRCRRPPGGAVEVKASSLLLLSVELVLQLHEFAWRFDLVGNLLPLREETLALLEGQTLRVAAGDRVLLLLTARRTSWQWLLDSIRIMHIEHEKSHNYKGLGRADGIFCKSFVFVLCKGRTWYWKWKK